jgi:hypothetical protein
MYDTHQQTVRRGSLDFYGPLEPEILNLIAYKIKPFQPNKIKNQWGLIN